ncbi:hypothetical protein [Rubrivivax benzoatilyticus]|uniref:Uncharacterized protein n=1 Tax=Rubrivivax benzoatilyticus TaxID=316997 RepID=A0ABX0HTB3_9BURK|nr:hypothetical protein [Rubrivivax benzoatilyticus]EGJ12060.1 hypothetical protein RBXJA2T_17097 [Rubrivivax benzoatilyticus JA2 = ATCC BAA-35]NHK96994.1 hypothetical protein [Rubrivivax benzoatilyticus]NHL24709.1 hypothetical protein [Rubrivivax benzoatilyticus]
MHAATAAAQGWMPTEDRARPDTPALEACYRSEAFAEDLREPQLPRAALRRGWRVLGHACGLQSGARAAD